MNDLVGKNLGQYHIIAQLGRGHPAKVYYKAYQPAMERYVFIKAFDTHQVDAGFLRRFEREAVTIARLNHSNVVKCFDLHHESDTYFMALEYINGPTLKEELLARSRANKFSLAEIAHIFTSLCSAIDYVHSKDVIHRDIKPAHVMLDQAGQVKLVGFGVVRLMSGIQFTQTGTLLGTPAFMSPEQGMGERGDQRSDIYALGVLLYEIVAGTVPYQADTPFAVIMKHISEPVPLPGQRNPTIPEGMERVILKAMSKNRNDRYQTAKEMSTALNEATDIKPNEKNILLKVVGSAQEIQPDKERLDVFNVFLPPKTNVILKLTQYGHEFSIANQPELTIGRTSKKGNMPNPDIDLTPYGGRQGGVSRRHGRLLCKDDQWYVEDFGSANGTYLDGIRISSNQMIPIHEGATLRFGRMELEFRLEKSHEEIRVMSAEPNDLSQRSVQSLIDELVGALLARDWHDEPAERTALKQKIIKHGTSAVEPLLKVLMHDDWAVREEAAEMLEGIKDPRAVKPLTEVLDKFGGKSVASALDRIGTPEALAALKAWSAGPGIFLKDNYQLYGAWVNLKGPSLHRADRAGRDLRKRDLFMADLRSACFKKADLSEADLHWADLTQADFSEANLDGADLRVANLTRANFSGASLQGADLSRADFHETNLCKADLSGANLSKAYLIRADLSQANFSDADLSEANLSWADLRGANLRKANLSEANLHGADLRGADLKDANLDGANLYGVKRG